MEVINFFGGPGAGKSSIAAGLFYRMKQLGINVELVTEYFKELVWENTANNTTDYLYVLASQNRRLERLRDKVDYVITDSPLLLSGYYGLLYGNYPKLVFKTSREIFNTYKNINIFIRRNNFYNKIGRLENKKEAKKIDKDLHFILFEDHYINVSNNELAIDSCLNFVKKM